MEKSHLPPLILAVRLICVVDLIDADSEWWNTRNINTHFFPFEAQRVKSIPLCVIAQSNFLLWPMQRNGVYLIKFGYRLLCEDARRD